MENHLKERNTQRGRRSKRVRKKIRGNAEKPRMSVLRSNKHLQVQLIDDESHKTILGLGTLSKEFKGTEFSKRSKAAAREIGKRIAAEAKKKKISRVVFDRGHYQYHGLIAELANGAREEGLTF